MSDTVIKVEGLSKKFCRSLKRSMFYGTIDVFRSMIGIPYDTRILRKNEFWALEDLSFEIKNGDILGIIGINGSGKTTLLRMITGIFPPDKGRITVRGRIGALISVGAGFHPHMSGRENIYLNGTILGMTRKEIDTKLNDIIEFSEVGDFIEAPVSSYSSGMKVRLGFSIAAHINPDILLIDEILSVGDLGFRNKSLKFMADLREKSKAVLFVSHNIDQIYYLCNKVLVIDRGKKIFFGNAEEGVRFYEKEVYLKPNTKKLKPIEKYDVKKDLRESLGFGVKLLDLLINGQKSDEKNPVSINQGTSIECEVTIELEKLFNNCAAVIHCCNSLGQGCFVTYSNESGLQSCDLLPGKYTFTFKLPPLFLREGIYEIRFSFRNIKTIEIYERQHRVAFFSMLGDKQRQRYQYFLTPTATCSVKNNE